MSNIKNVQNAVGEVASVNRAQIEHRATWMALIFDEMKKAGIADAEQIVRRAIRRCGVMHGEGIKARMADDSAAAFNDAFLTPLGIDSFNMDQPVADAENLNVDFKYCALISAWQKLGMDDATCDLLCDLAMEGDRGIAEAVGLKFDLKHTIAQGCDTCGLHFYK
ncbi:MAG: L-2-amino-thiazoline-4-carboxylic acid hydrolase [Oscillospiraceae bacterium]|nr:L-2-amino-thiazoline-4-carboxylic acid hydrolase [Oscillospiraceae bacterium]